MNQFPLPSSELQVLTFLYARMRLSPTDRNRLHNLSRGFEGELKFYQLLKKHQTSKSINLFDLRLKVKQNELQIDSLLIFQERVFLIEVKNFEGHYYVNQDKWYSIEPKSEIQNPLSQLKRSELLLVKFFQQNGIHLPITPCLIFIHPEFILYQAPYDKSIIFPGQLRRFIQSLNNTPDSITREHREIQQVLSQQHIQQSSHVELPEYNFRKLKKGILCNHCGKLLTEANRVMMECKYCGNEERKEDAVIRSIYEFTLLFPDEKISVKNIHDWCGGSVSNKTIRRILANELEKDGGGRSTSYILSEEMKYSFLNKMNWFSEDNFQSFNKCLLTFK